MGLTCIRVSDPNSDWIRIREVKFDLQMGKILKFMEGLRFQEEKMNCYYILKVQFFNFLIFNHQNSGTVAGSGTGSNSHKSLDSVRTRIQYYKTPVITQTYAI